MAYYNPDQFYFGTVQSMRMIPAPVRGMQANPEGWGSTSTFLNGGALSRSSADSHKTYDMEWRSSSAPRTAQLLKSYADGTYGRGLIYFQDPSTYLHNVLPARWADPSMALGYEGRGIVYGVDPSEVPTVSPRDLDLPLRSASYDLRDLQIGYRGDMDSLFVPVPRGMKALAGWAGEGNGASSFRWCRVNASGDRVEESDAPVPMMSGDWVTSPEPLETESADAGIRLYVARQNMFQYNLTLSAVVVRLVPEDWPEYRMEQASLGPWVGGMGNSGCQFEGKPTWTTNTAAYGGQISATASFVETGDWYFG